LERRPGGEAVETTMPKMDATETQPFFPYADLATLPPDLRRLLQAYEERMGFLPNALRMYAHSPHILKQIIRTNNTVMRHTSNSLDEEFKYRMSFIISRNHGCRYCCAHHADTLRTRFGCDDTDLRDILQLRRPRSEREAAAWAFAHAASRGPEHTSDEHRGALAAFFTPEEIVEIAATLGFWAFYNRIHANLDVPIEAHLLSEAGWVDVQVE
jgi:uncharacterized peroxidase-related enzyme